MPESKPRRAVDLTFRNEKVLISLPVLSEIREVLGCKQFRRYVDDIDVRAFLAALTSEAEWIDTVLEIKACRDPKDDKFLELAVSGHATHIISGDSDLLALNPFQDIQIIPPHSFLELLLSSAP